MYTGLTCFISVTIIIIIEKALRNTSHIMTFVELCNKCQYKNDTMQ